MVVAVSVAARRGYTVAVGLPTVARRVCVVVAGMRSAGVRFVFSGLILEWSF